MGLVRTTLAALLTVLAAGGPAAAQSPATADPHPTMPWNQYGRADHGQPIRYIQMPPQQVVIETRVPTPDGVPPQTQQQVVEIPGYVMTETTTGYVLPDRWTLDQLNVGVYQWRRVPGEFRRK